MTRIHPDGGGLVAAVMEISCVTAAICEGVATTATDGVAIRTVDGGTSWVLHHLAGSGAPLHVSCSSATVCEVVTNAGSLEVADSSRDGGTSWTSQQLPNAIYLDISCPSPTVCEVVGEVLGTYKVLVLRTTDGGSRWVAQSLPAGSSGQGELLTNISCASVSVCEIVAEYGPVAAFRTDDGGSTWTRQDLPAGYTPVSALSCPSSTVCESSGTNGTSLEILRLA